MTPSTRPRNRATMFAIVGTMSIVLGACGSNNDAGSSTSAASAEPVVSSTPVETAPSASAAADSTEASTSTPSSEAPNSSEGSTSAPSSDTPVAGGTIVVGLANDEGPGLSAPEFRFGAEAAIQYINANGGVNGKQIDVVECIADGSPEGSVNCANKFVEAGAVVYLAGSDIGGDAALPILSGAGIPFVSSFPWGGGQQTDPGAHMFGVGSTAFYNAPLAALQAADATSLAYFYYDIPTVQQATPIIQGLAAAMGIEITPIAISITNPDWTAAVATAMADGLGSMWGVLQEGDCTNMVRAARSAGFDGPIAVGSCSTYISAVGDQAINTLAVWPYFFPELSSVAPPEIQDQLAMYEKAMTAADHADAIGGFATATFATTMVLGEILATVDGEVTGPTLQAAIEAAKVPGFMGPEVNCIGDVFPGQPSACSSKILLLKVVNGPDGPVRELLQPDYFDAAAG